MSPSLLTVTQQSELFKVSEDVCMCVCVCVCVYPFDCVGFVLFLNIQEILF